MGYAESTSSIWTNRVLLSVLFVVGLLWLVMPFALAALWSLVDVNHPWAYPAMFPPVLSFSRWIEVWNTTALPQAMINSYTLAPCVATLALILAMPTAYAFGRMEFPGKSVMQVLTLLPLVLPGFVVAIFFSSLLIKLGIYSRFLGILIGHTVMFLPFAIRLLTVSFTLIRQDLIDAARDMGASPIGVFRAAYLPILRPGVIAAFIIVFIQSIEEFALSYVIGAPDFTTVPTILFSYLGYNFIRPNAAVVSLILVVPNVLLMLLVERFLGRANPAAITGKG
ncbi:putative spermidine/putrescine transport system permease protein [Rhizobium sp. BK077]|uniref:ABC transporter permease n=1 Tax=unclassified Rhizobium TaxID=2613769 RepID=UPI0016180B58|nr:MULTISPECIES: ABC transporter permease [unclassified Rhizobium]MBB3302198.1 putative spermidine/putrescine transport system permease protein [Rhizobium sp. BK112]MBB3371320.1 putative spermidine/putrescine transport system permease protein [Rhizobium sp. BK077]MBB4182192.1 putative spermidine/putrescine transport system permease protein [Rhizobium sp. BK109]MBB4255621.1 putative spermidine/putrescine transport system permease protein [Rhizobium sp. BK008]